MSFWKSIKQDVVADNNNSSSTNITTTTPFVGTVTSTLGVAGIQVSLKTDQNCHVYVQQAPSTDVCAGKGTVATNNSTTLTGTGTQFTREVGVGDTIIVDQVGTNQTRIIASIESDTSLTVTDAFTGGSLSGKTYHHYPWDISDEFDYFASINNLGVTVQAINSYIRVKVINIGVATTEYFRLQTALCPIVEALPRSLDEDGNLKIGVRSIADEYGFSVENTPMGEMRIAEPVRLVGTSFEGTTIDPTFWTTAATGTAATIAQANAQLLITSGTSNGATVTAYTSRRARYVGGSSMRYRSVIQIDAGTANNTRRWGIGYGATMPTITDGAWFQMSGTTFSVVTMKGGSETTVSSGSFNGTLGATYDPGTTVKTYEIYWTNSKVYFVVGDTILHTVTASSATWASTMAFHAFQDSVNSNTASSVTLAARTVTIYRLGRLETAPAWRNIHGANAGTQLKYGGGKLHNITVNGVANGSQVYLYDATSATNPIALWASSTTSNLGTFDYNLDFYTGLYVVTANASTDVTIVFE